MSPNDEENGGSGRSPADPPDSGPAAAAATDRVFEALADCRRRFALYYLRERRTATAEELATVVAGWLTAREDQTAVVTPEYRRSVLAELHHHHLPVLESAGLVSYDAASGDARLESLSETAAPILDRSFELERTSAPTCERARRGDRSGVDG